MDVRIAVPDQHVSKDILDAGLEMNTRVSESLMRGGEAPTFTDAVKGGVQWKPEPPGAERFDNALTVGKRGWGDCDDLAPMRAAELRVSGKDPAARAVAYKSGPGRWHAIVQRGDGQLEDPSRTAGMRVREGSFAAGIAPAVVGMMGHVVVGGGVRPFVAVRRDQAGYLARVDVPVEGESFAISCVQRGPSPSRALSGCMAGACAVGGTCGFVDEQQLDRMWALHGLMQGATAAQVCGICGAEATRDALETLQEIAPALVAELRRHWEDARVLREDFERRKGSGRADRAVPLAGKLAGDYDEHAARFGHDARESPYRDRWEHRGRGFVGAATSSPYNEMAAQRRTWGNPRAFMSEQMAPAMRQTTMTELQQQVGTATDSPYMRRWLEHHEWGVRRAGVSEQAVEGATMSPYMQRWLDHRTWGIDRAGVSEQAVSGVALPFKPTLSFSLAGSGTHRRHARAHRARHIIHGVDFGEALDRALRAPPVSVGWDLFKDVIAPAGDALSHLVTKAANLPPSMHVDLAATASGALASVQGVISLIPGIGTGISSAISAGLALIQGGSPLEIAVKAAYGAIPIPPGLRTATDIVVDAALSLATTQNLADAGVSGIRRAVLDKLPGPAKDIGATVFDTLAHLVLGAVHNAPTHAAVSPSPAKGFPPKVAVLRTPAHYAAVAKVATAQAKKRVIDLRAVSRRVAPAPKPAVVPVAKVAPPPTAPAASKPLTLDMVVRAFQPMVVRHAMVIPPGVVA